MPKRAVLVYVIHNDHVLMIYGAEPYAPHYQRYNGLGGKIEEDQTPAEAAVEEVYEEANLIVSEENLDHVGQIRFRDCRKPGADWLVDVYRVYTFRGIPKANGREGHIRWYPIDDIPAIPTNSGDQIFLPWVFARKKFDTTVQYDRVTGLVCLSCTPTFRD